MIDIQNHIRNEGLLNLFDGRAERSPPILTAVGSSTEVRFEGLGRPVEVLVESVTCSNDVSVSVVLGDSGDLQTSRYARET